MKYASGQQGFILMPVVIAIVLIATITFMLNNQNAININESSGLQQAERVEHIARAGLADAMWKAQNNSCNGDMVVTSVPFGQGSYAATVDTGGVTTSSYRFTPDHDGVIEEKNPDHNHASDDKIKLNNKPGEVEHALFHYDLSSIASNSKVVTATAWFYVDTKDDKAAVTLHPVTADWTEASLTWDAVGGKFDPAVYGGFPLQLNNNVWVSINVTALAQSWVNDPASNYGFLLNATSDNVQSKYSSREFGDASLRPYLQMTIADGDVSPLSISATGTLTGNPTPANDISRSITRSAVTAYQPVRVVVSQPGAEGKDGWVNASQPSFNFGTTMEFGISGGANPKHFLLELDLSAIPYGSKILSANLEMNLKDIGNKDAAAEFSVYRMTEAWTEGSGDNSNPGDGASWNTSDGSTSWSWSSNHDDANPVATIPVNPTFKDWHSWDIKLPVQQWVSGQLPNYGLFISGNANTVDALFQSSDWNTPEERPRLTISYVCECGSHCLAPQSAGNVLLVVADDTTPGPSDSYRKSMLESWGYTVNLLDDNAAQAEFDASTSSNDVAYISETVNSAAMGSKLTNAAIGVVSEQGLLNDELGLAASFAYTVDPAINVTDTSHYITALFPAGPLDIYSAGMEQLTVSGGDAPGLQTLANAAGAGSLVVLDTGAALGGSQAGANAAGRRVMLPLGREGNFNWDYLNKNGRLLVQRAIQWGKGSAGSAHTPINLLMVVTNPTGLDAQEQAKKTLIESWGYSVNLIDDSDTQAAFDAAVAANDVVFIPAQINDVALNNKLVDAAIGIVNEKALLGDEFGISSSYAVDSTSSSITITDNTHYITETFPIGPLQVLNSAHWLFYLTGTQSTALDLLATTPSGDGLATLEAGDALYAGGTAAGRRVKLPWGGPTQDFSLLNDDARTIMRRAIEWAAGTGSGSSCNADYIPDSKISEFSTASYGSNNIKGLTFYPEGELFNGVAAPAGGAWISINDGADVVYMTDSSGTLLTSVALSSGSQTGIAFVSAGSHAGQFATTDYYVSGVSWMDTSGSIVSTFTNPGFANPVGVAYIEKTLSGSYDDSIALISYSSGNWIAHITDQDGNVLQTLNVSSITNNPEDITHIPGSDKLLIVDRGSQDVIVIDFTGAELSRYSIAGYGSSVPNDIAINPLSCDHVVADLGVDLVMSLNVSGGGGGTPPPVACDGTFRDEFNARSYSNSDGTLTWATDWEETGETDSPWGGDIRITNDVSNYQLLVRDDGQTVMREADLSGAASATLTFDYRRENLSGSNDYVALEVSYNGGSSWTELDRYTGTADDGSYTGASYGLESSLLSATTRIRFRTPVFGMGNSNQVLFDNIQIQCSP